MRSAHVIPLLLVLACNKSDRQQRVTVKARDRAQVPELQAMTELRVHALEQLSS